MNRGRTLPLVCVRHAEGRWTHHRSRCRYALYPDFLRPMRAKGQSTQRTIERLTKGYAR